EGVLFDALSKARLIDPDAGFEGCDWSRCGRTDSGVSSAGQVVAVRVRSTLRPLATVEEADAAISSSTPPEPEIQYLRVLNRILPDSIRIIAWASVRENFSARFDCRYRHYKYFFNSLPPPSGPLDIDLMQEAASRLVGTHDFRNFCKLDGSKQIERYDRRVNSAAISRVKSTTEGDETLFVLDLIGSAFLWHQVRHIMAILFLVGQRLEDVDIVDTLLNANPERPNPDASIPLLPNRPLYDMADGLPLVLWECGFDKDDVTWRTDEPESTEVTKPTASPSTVQLLESMNSSHTSSVIRTALLRHFLEAAEVHHESASDRLVRLQRGGGHIQHINKYVPLLKRKRGPTPAEVNENWRKGRGQVLMDRRARAKAIDPSVEKRLPDAEEGIDNTEKGSVYDGERIKEMKIREQAVIRPVFKHVSLLIKLGTEASNTYVFVAMASTWIAGAGVVCCVMVTPTVRYVAALAEHSRPSLSDVDEALHSLVSDRLSHRRQAEYWLGRSFDDDWMMGSSRELQAGSTSQHCAAHPAAMVGLPPQRSSLTAQKLRTREQLKNVVLFNASTSAQMEPLRAMLRQLLQRSTLARALSQGQ
ncbi:13529_t:CDS:2, partial [Acaulospora colombiana]